MTYYLNRPLTNLRNEINTRFPKRDKSSDGWIGDPSHQAAKSSHNPDYSSKPPGAVRAIDTDIDDHDPNQDLRKQIIQAAIKHRSTWYIISNEIIYSRTYGFQPKKYTGANGHWGHVHVSTLDKDWADDVNDPWFISSTKVASARLNHFRESRPNWDVKILDRMFAAGRRDLGRKINAIEEAVKDLPKDEKNTRVTEFKETFHKRRILRLALLNEAIVDGRTGDVKEVRDTLNLLIKTILR